MQATTTNPIATLPAVTYSWDNDDELTGLSTVGTAANLTYFPDAQRKTLAVTSGTTTVTSTYGYDPASQRLSQIGYASTQNANLGTPTYSYDADGRVTGKDGGSLAAVNLPSPSATAAAYDSVNQITTWTNGAAAGNDPDHSLTSDPASSAAYAWDQREALMSATISGTTTSYGYDAGGRRESVTAGGTGGTTTKYLYDGTTPVQVTTGAATPVSILSLPDSNEILSINGAIPIHDALGTVLGGVDTSSGQFQYRYKYDPFGGFQAMSGLPSMGPTGYGNVYAMAGIEYDGATKLYHAGARYYSPSLQRFLSEDSVRGQSNLFGYAGNNPVSGSDPSGQFYWQFTFGGNPIFGFGNGAGGWSSLEPSSIIAVDPYLAILAVALDVFVFDSSSSPPQPTFVALQQELRFGDTNNTAGMHYHVASQGGPGPGQLLEVQYKKTEPKNPPPEIRKPFEPHMSFAGCYALLGVVVGYGLPCAVGAASCGSGYFGNPEALAACPKAAQQCLATAIVVATCAAVSHGGNPQISPDAGQDVPPAMEP